MSKDMQISPVRMTEIESVVEELYKSSEILKQTSLCDAPMPSREKLSEIIERLKAIIFPGYFGPSKVHPESLRYHLSASLDSVYRLLAEQIRRGGCFACADYANDCRGCSVVSHEKSMDFIKKVPAISKILNSDAISAYEGDPAASSPGEAIFCYPSMVAMIHHRIAHELYKLGIPVIPRMISEMAHSQTGIDIHPGATIGENFFIDHGTGVVIGETCIIGKNCRIYQGVTLGALSFQKDKETGMLVKGIDRHPILEENVTVYAGATILGRITIGANSVIGGNVWLTHSIEANSRISQGQN